MGEFGRRQNLTPGVLLPLGTQLFIALDNEDPIAFAPASDSARVQFIPFFGLVMMNASGDLFGTLQSTGCDPFFVDKYQQFIENISGFCHPRHRLFGEIVCGKKGCDAH
jgi:hypothetical protein